MDELIQALPHAKGAALRRAGTGVRPFFNAGHRRQRILRQTEDPANRVVFGRLCQLVASAFAAQTA